MTENPNRREAVVLAAVASLALVPNLASGGEPVRKEHAVTNPDPKTLDDLAKRAKAASERAYCPYSKFRVGAAILADDGTVHEGCNVENASYGLTICAERNAVFQMIAKGGRKIVAVAIYTPTPKPSAPCGACRQVLNEFGPDALVTSVCDGPDVLRKKLSELLPDAFGPANLDK